MLGILVVTTLDASEVLSADLVQGLFALPPAEARVATLIGSGLSPRQAAKLLGISEGNARNTLKHVFRKLGVTRQNELAALLAKLPKIGFPYFTAAHERTAEKPTSNC
jgi:DNA-binding CsgD family transcriptional regulator